MIDKVYSPGEIEPKWSKAWRESKAFHADANGPGGPYVIVIPPPNITGALHIGHALNNTLQDVLIRYHKLLGRRVCWVPGTDHGGIATQSVMEKQLKAEGKTRGQLGRDHFLERMREWTISCKSTILGQLERLGCALDWEREAFTMDEPRAKSVFKAFEDLWKKGYIKRGERMVNWCVRCGTALSDVEVEHEDRKGKLWHLHYPLEDGQPGLTVATTRPETMLGDTAVAVNPRDVRYTKLVGKKLRLPLMDRIIPVIADDSVDFAFGTGAVKITPAHDPNDFEIGTRHNLPFIKVIGPDGKMTSAAGKYVGLSREQAREKVLADLGDVLVKTEDHAHAVGCCYRCGSIIEPLLSWQWFVIMKPLAERALAAVDSGAFTFFPEDKNKAYREWLKNIKDWCVSRQIWWGHRIPVWYCLNCNRDLLAAAPKPGEGDREWSVHQIAGVTGVVSFGKPERCAKCGQGDFIQDPDVLDTWFSSALWPFSVFGWPGDTPEIRAFYPGHVLVTGYEIINLWVARMQMMGLEFLGKPPFPHSVIHGIVRDKTGKKMSKSLGNVIDPLVMMDKFGTDALRFSLMLQAHPGRDIPFAEDSITGSRNFANKIWNSTRFVLMNLPEAAPAGGYKMSKLSHCCLELSDKWILAEYQAVLEQFHKELESYEVAAAADALYGFLWDKFCDWYVELSKIRLQGIDGEEKDAARTILVQVLTGVLKLLHPFMPFITEELYVHLKPYSGETAGLLSLAEAPTLDRDWSDTDVREKMGRLMEMIRAIRTLRAELNVPPGMKIKAHYFAADDSASQLLAEHQSCVLHLARLEALEPMKRPAKPESSVTTVAAGITFYLPLKGVIDLEKERERLGKAISALEEDLAALEERLANPAFADKAPRDKVQAVRVQRDEVLAKLARLKETLASLG